MCDKCGSELKDFGGILLSPPDKESKVKKFHVCAECYRELEKELKAKV